MDIESIRGRTAAAGLAWRGALHPAPGDLAPPEAGTIVLVGFIGSDQWPGFAGSPEASDGLSDPLDRWSRRVIAELAASLEAQPLFPFDGPPYFPFQRWARKAEPVFPSPLGILIHPEYGLWHAYRGALSFPERLALPDVELGISPCDSCAAKPCLTACPVGAFTPAGYDVPACTDYLVTPVGADCLDSGCRARRGCPVGSGYRHSRDQAGFHARAFLRAQQAIAQPR